MQLTVYGKGQPVCCLYKKYISVFVILLFLSVGSSAQQISLSFKKASITAVFKEIEKKTEYRFVYTKEELTDALPITVDITAASIETVLNEIFSGQPLSYSLNKNYVLVHRKETLGKPSSSQSGFNIKGRVISEQGENIVGATIKLKNTAFTALSDNNGEFSFQNIDPGSILAISSVGFITKEVNLNGQNEVVISLPVYVQALDQTIIIAYGTTTNRLNTGNVSKVTAEEISKQPVSNVLAALQGRVPGLIITQSSGLSGASMNITLRGQNSLIQGSEPFFIVDGVPFVPGNTAINLILNATSTPGLSPFNLINPDNIESIEILKDADATAIYGSRGANGVILITTKKGKEGKTKFSFGLRSGLSKVTRTMNLLNTQQYLVMRREAFSNDGITPNGTGSGSGFAPDIFIWDTTKFTDYKKLLIGGTAHFNNIQASLSGGNASTLFKIGGSYFRETTVFPGNLADQKAAFNLNLSHSSIDKKFQLILSTNYLVDKNELTARDLTSKISLPPHIELLDSVGKLKWSKGSTSYQGTIGIDPNPLSYLHQRFTGKFQNLISNLQLHFNLLKGLTFKTSLGYNLINGDEIKTQTSTSIDPYSTATPSSDFGVQTQKGWIIEPHAEYAANIGKGKLTFLIGGTWQENTSNAVTISATNYSSDVLLSSISGAGSVIASNSYSQYKYTALFSRLNYNWDGNYLLNLTARRDGSSRFGPQNQFANFGAAGAAWIFSKEKFFKPISFLSFGKLRSSYGLTGNDQIGNYRFLDTWNSSASTYQGIAVLDPTALFNKELAWETNKKFEIGIDLGFIRDRVMISAAYFINNSSNQLINYTLPIQTGFNSINKNFDARVENRGFELVISSRNVFSTVFKWSSAFNISFLRNRLVDFPSLATSSYSTSYIIGEPVSVRRVYHYLGVDPNTGTYKFLDVNNDGIMNTTDRVSIVNATPSFFGGLSNNFDFKNFQLDVFCEFKKQKGRNYLNTLTGKAPGYQYYNQPEIVLNRWQKLGDIAEIQKFTSSSSSMAYRSANLYLPGSDAAYSDASFIRIKNISLGYSLSPKLLRKLEIESCQFTVQAQNFFTITNYLGADPENQNMFILPPLKTITMGVNLSF